MGQNRLMALAPYNIGFNTINGTIAVQIKYPKGWQVIKPDEGSQVKFHKDGEISYYWIENSLDIDPILDVIDETVDVNKDMEARVALLSEKAAELKQLFIDKPLEELRTLEFTFKKPTVKTKAAKSTTSSKKADSNNNTISADEIEPMAVTFDKKEKIVTEIKSNNTKEDSDIDKKIARAMGLQNE